MNFHALLIKETREWNQHNGDRHC